MARRQRQMCIRDSSQEDPKPKDQPKVEVKTAESSSQEDPKVEEELKEEKPAEKKAEEAETKS